jgi:hypothetical protein
MKDAEVVADLDRALAATEAVVAGVRPDQWAAPTPCTELDARGVLNHLVRGNLLFVAIIRDQPRPVPGTDHLARATGQRGDFPDDVAERTLARSKRRLVTRPEGPGAPFAAEVPVPADAPAVDRLAGFLGRAV